MFTIRIIQWMLSLVLILLPGVAVFGQTYPNKPIRIVTAPVGGGSDFLARVIAEAISGPLRHPVIVENRPNRVIGDIVAQAAPDGYTLILVGGSFWTAPFLEKKTYDPVKDFTPITIVEKSPAALVVHNSMAASSVKELIALAKARPGDLNYASTPTGGASHLAAELFKSMAGVNIVGIPYAGTGPALTALLGGQVQLMFANPLAAAPHLKAGRLRMLGVTSLQPTALAPGSPTVAASLPGYESVSVSAMMAPAKTPAAIINRLNEEIVRVLNRPAVKEQFLNAGSETVGSTPGELAAKIKSDRDTMAKVIKDAGIKPE